MPLTTGILYSNVLMHRESSGSLLAEDIQFLQWFCVSNNENSTLRLVQGFAGWQIPHDIPPSLWDST